MTQAYLDHVNATLSGIAADGMMKQERMITSPQSGEITVGGRQVINLCANNYLGLADHPDLIAAARDAMDPKGFGMASVRFICGTQDIHRELEQKLAAFLGKDDSILFAACFDANGGLFETLLGPEDAVISDELNHASIIDGVRLCKAKRFRYKNNDMDDLAAQLAEAKGARRILIVTDGVFSMDGYLANLPAICDLADEHSALVMVDDSHAVGFMGERGRGTHEHQGVLGRVDLITGTLGKALGGASGGFTSGRKEIIGWLRQRSRPYLFSNSVAPAIAATSIAVLNLIESDDSLRKKLHDNATRFRQGMSELGFDLKPGEHPIIPVMLSDAKLASDMADKLLEHDIYVIGFSFPVVPKGEARIRTQMSAGLTDKHVDQAIDAFGTVGHELGVIN